MLLFTPTPTALGSSSTATPAANARARAASTKTVTIREEAHLRISGTPGSLLVEQGQGTGTIRGRVKVSFSLNGSKIEGTFTAYPRSGGSLSGYASGNLSAPHGEFASFGGTITHVHGTGSFRHATGSGRIYGVINRINYGLTVQVLGTLHL